MKNQNEIVINPLEYNIERSQPYLEDMLEKIISDAALMTDSLYTRDDDKRKIVQECNNVRKALQNLLSEYMDNVSTGAK